MKHIAVVLVLILLFGCHMNNDPEGNHTMQDHLPRIDTSDATNDFFDNVVTHKLPLRDIRIDGEIHNPGRAEFQDLTLRSVMVKETRINDEGNKFIGACRYDGYSLYDLLNRIRINKLNREEFSPIIDLYVIIRNNKGEKAVFSWGELFYPVHQHQIIIAIRVAQIVPSKSKERWPLTDKAKLVVATDLLTERNISDPVRITIKSLERSFDVDREIDPLYSDRILFIRNDSLTGQLSEYPVNLIKLTYPTIFYGRGRGIHGVNPFEGVLLREVLSPYVEISDKAITRGIVTISAKDGYRAAYSFSEIFNRNDQAEILLINRDEDRQGGKFSIFPAADFFSDRAVKAINEIYVDFIDE